MDKSTIKWYIDFDDDFLYIKETTPDGDSEGVTLPLDILKDIIEIYNKANKR